MLNNKFSFHEQNFACVKLEGEGYEVNIPDKISCPNDLSYIEKSHWIMRKYEAIYFSLNMDKLESKCSRYALEWSLAFIERHLYRSDNNLCKYFEEQNKKSKAFFKDAILNLKASYVLGIPKLLAPSSCWSQDSGRNYNVGFTISIRKLMEEGKNILKSKEAGLTRR